MAKNQSRCVTLLSARESIGFLGKIAIANVKQSGGSLAHTNKLDRQLVECHLENSRKSRYQLIYQLSKKAGSKVWRPVCSFATGLGYSGTGSQCRRCALRCQSRRHWPLET